MVGDILLDSLLVCEYDLRGDPVTCENAYARNLASGFSAPSSLDETDGSLADVEDFDLAAVPRGLGVPDILVGGWYSRICIFTDRPDRRSQNNSLDAMPMNHGTLQNTHGTRYCRHGYFRRIRIFVEMTGRCDMQHSVNILDSFVECTFLERSMRRSVSEMYAEETVVC